MKKFRFLIYLAAIVLSYIYLYPRYDNIIVIFLPAIILELVYSFFSFQKKVIEIVILGLVFFGAITYIKLDSDGKREVRHKAECAIKCKNTYERIEDNKCYCNDGTIFDL